MVSPHAVMDLLRMRASLRLPLQDAGLCTRQYFPQEASPAIYRSCGASCIGLPFFDRGCVVAESLGRLVSLLHEWVLGVLYRAGHRGNSQGMFYQIGCSGESVGLHNRFLYPASIFTVSRGAQHLT